MINKLLLLSLLGSIGSIGYVEYSHYTKLRDLDFVYQQLCDNHPGFYNDMDLDFKRTLQQGYDEAKLKISELYWWENHIFILKEYLKKFNDNHLHINQENVTLQASMNNIKKYNVFIESLSDQDVIIHIPTFMPNDEQQKQFENVIDEISKLYDLKNIIFDLRHNSGGNSELGTQILKALFGTEYVEQQLYELYKNQTVWWRVSKDNSIHLDTLIEYFSKNKELNSEILLWLTGINKGVKQALNNNEIFYIEQESTYKKPKYKTSCPVQAKIIVVIDKMNVSSALDFIAELQSLTKDILFIGHTTKADTIYMEIRIVPLPSKQGMLQYPIKMYHNRPRGNNQSYGPDIICPEKDINDKWLSDTIQKIIDA